ncbi:hypothetical protein [Candidatus Alkanophaga liquidiphilum]|nr:hypothetical protein [Candidatus Alkanophaga liquidiphilum]RLG37589.1 MAG: hypothetical protein DRN91_05065 [Candidatus Alkanophagales archaeon]
MGAEEEVLLKRLKIKLDHWIEHNREHEESFIKEAENAKDAGLEGVAMLIEEAARKMREATHCLMDALNMLS